MVVLFLVLKKALIHESHLSDQSGKKLREALTEAQRAALLEGMAAKADALIAKGEPIGLDIAVVVATRANK